MEKAEIRAHIRAREAALGTEEIAAYSAALTEKLTASDPYRAAATLLCYLPFGKELRTEGLIRAAWADGKTVAVPKVIAPGQMEFYCIRSFQAIAPGFCGIPEPTGTEAAAPIHCPTLMLMPGLAFGRDGSRIGYGGGYYDRYLQHRLAEGTPVFRLALAYEFQIFDTLPTQLHDFPADMVMSCSETITVRKDFP